MVCYGTQIKMGCRGLSNWLPLYLAIHKHHSASQHGLAGPLLTDIFGSEETGRGCHPPVLQFRTLLAGFGDLRGPRT